jgi:hypothetical protein
LKSDQGGLAMWAAHKLAAAGPHDPHMGATAAQKSQAYVDAEEIVRGAERGAGDSEGCGAGSGAG